ncbi:uncharacterized protein [Nicotiana sylvestris]|uniref:uncharacterized protein n=1 Tax=Nicotiana sylvestris TaxID=4096 RepID=UPI00388C344E
MGSLAYIPVGERPLALDIKAFANQFMRLDVSEPSRVLACIVARSSLFERIRERRYDDLYFLVLRDTAHHSDTKRVTVGNDGVLRMQGRVCVSNVDRIRKLILEEAYSSQCSIHSGVAKMYQDLRQHYCWRRMKKDIVVYRKFDAILVIMDRLTKSAHFNPVAVSYSSERLAEIYMRDIVRLHGVPVSTISD